MAPTISLLSISVPQENTASDATYLFEISVGHQQISYMSRLIHCETGKSFHRASGQVINCFNVKMNILSPHGGC